MRITRLSVARSCAVCERTLLMGERSTRFTPDGENFVDVTFQGANSLGNHVSGTAVLSLLDGAGS